MKTAEKTFPSFSVFATIKGASPSAAKDVRTAHKLLREGKGDVLLRERNQKILAASSPVKELRAEV